MTKEELKELKDESDVNLIIFEALMYVAHESTTHRAAFDVAFTNHNVAFNKYQDAEKELENEK